MEQDSQVNILEAQLRECFGRVVWTHKAHEKSADILIAKSNIIKNVQIILSALTATGIFVTIGGSCKEVEIITAIISTALLALNTFIKGKDLGEIAQKHRDVAVDLWNIREKYFSFITDIHTKRLSVGEIISTRDKLQEELACIYKGSPRTLNKAYKKATEALKLNEELTFSVEEIDNFLPKELRKG